MKQHGRRAAANRVKTPLTELTESLSANSGTVGRRAAVVAAAGGLLASVGVPSAVSAHNDSVVSSESQQSAPASDSVDYQAQAKTVAEGADAKHKGSAVAGAAETQSVSASKAPKPKPKPKPKAESNTQHSSAAEHTTTTTKASARHSTAEQDKQASSSTKKSTSDSKKSNKKSSSKSVAKPSGSKAQQVIALAKQGVGTPYVSGGTSPSGWDCSGFTTYVYGKVGVDLPRTSGAQASAGKAVSKSEAKPGDLIVSPGHVGIYAGNGQMYDAGNSRVDTSKRSADWMLQAGGSFRRVL